MPTEPLSYVARYEKETGKDSWSHCGNCGRHSAYDIEFVEWLVNRERKNCIRSAREKAASLASTGEHQRADELERFADELESLEEISL